MDGKSIMDQERPLLAFLSSLGLRAMVIHYDGTEIKSGEAERVRKSSLQHQEDGNGKYFLMKV